MRYLHLIIISVLIAQLSLAQCPTASFTIPTQACRSQPVSVVNSSTNYTQTIWDFCETELDKNSSVSFTSQLNDAFRGTYCFDYIRTDKPWILSLRNSGELNLVELSSDLTATVGSRKIIGGLSGAFSLPRSIEIIQESGVYYALVCNSGSSPITLVNLGTDLSTLTTATYTQFAGVGVSTNGAEITSDGNGNYVVFAGQNSGNTVYRLQFTGSIKNTPTVTSFSVTGATTINEISITKTCTGIYGIVTSANNKIFLLNFSSGLLSAPVVSQINYTGDVFSSPAKFDIVLDQSNYFGFLVTELGSVYRLNFGSSLTNNPTSKLISNSNVSGYDIKMIEKDNIWKGLFEDLSVANRSLNLITFTNNCSLSPSFSSQNVPNLQYLNSGTYPVTLKVSNNAGYQSSITKYIDVLNFVGPSINFSINGICKASPTNFTLSTDKTLVSTSWDFGDGNVSTISSPSHTFSNTGIFNPVVSVVDTDGCPATLTKSTTIYNPPTPGINMVAVSPLCTGQQYSITNATTYDPGSAPSYAWFVDGSEVSTSKDLLYTFDQEKVYNIALTASIPGCDVPANVNTPLFQEGPLVDFIYNGTPCAQQQILFSNLTTGNVSNYIWDFNDGVTTNVEEPTHAFNLIGGYDITLEASSPNGCQNSKTKSITIYSKPQTNFSLALPPFSCSGSLSQFYDTTPLLDDSNITFWLWDFGNGNTSSAQNPQYLFNSAGDYPVSLTVGSNFGCETTLQKTVTIQQTPTIAIGKSPACQNVPVQFSATSDVPIANWEWRIGDTYYYTQDMTHLFPDVTNYTVILKATANNNCVKNAQLPVAIHQPPLPSFSVLKNCDNQDTEFTNTTVSPSDPVSASQWDFGDGGMGDGSPTFHTYQNQGNVDVQLTVTTQEGCNYELTKGISIVAAPKASFIPTPGVGLPPLAVQFVNTSTNATHYLWEFNDDENNTSTLESPTSTFFEYGTHIVDLTAYNAFNCFSTFSGSVEVQSPFPDITLNDLNLSETQDGYLKAFLKITNAGNTIVRNLKLNIDLGGIIVQEVITQEIVPGTSIDHVVDFSVKKNTALAYFCITANLNDDVHPEDNQLCISYEDEIFFFNPFPNPSQGQLLVSWIAPENLQLFISIYDRLGRQYSTASVISDVGINQLELDLSAMTQGIYYVVMRSGSVRKTFPVVKN